MKMLDLFSGIGGFSVAAEAVGWEVVAHCECAEYPSAVLKKRWPNIPLFSDVRKLTKADLGKVDVITGGFPCQDVSLAGKQAGLGDVGDPTRSGLFREIVRLAEELQPSYVVMENVQGLLNNGMDTVGIAFNEKGWTLEWKVISAQSVGAPHIRKRVWMVAHKKGNYILDSLN